MTNRYAVFDEGLFVGFLELTIEGMKKLERAGFRTKRQPSKEDIERAVAEKLGRDFKLIQGGKEEADADSEKRAGFWNRYDGSN